MFIEVGEEVERTVYDFPVEMDEKTMDVMFEYARKYMTEDEFEKIMVEWAMVDILTKKIEETLNTENQEDK